MLWKALLAFCLVLGLLAAGGRADGGWDCSLVLECKGDFFLVIVKNTGPIPITGATVTLQQGVFVDFIGFLAPGDSKTLVGKTPRGEDKIGPAILSGTAGPFAVFKQSNVDRCRKDFDFDFDDHKPYPPQFTNPPYYSHPPQFDDHKPYPPQFTNPPYYSHPPQFDDHKPYPPQFTNPPYYTHPPQFTRPPQFPDNKKAHIKVEKSCEVEVDRWGKVEVCWVAKIKNDGDVPFTAITVTENTGELLTPYGAQALPVGEEIKVSGCYTPKDQNAKSFSDTVTVTGTTIFNDVKTFFDTATCFRKDKPGQGATTKKPKQAHLDIFKKCDVRIDRGDVLVDFEIVVKNDGDEKFKSLTVIDTDDKGNAPQTFIVSSGLDVGATTKIKGTYKPADQNDKKFTDKVKVIAVTWSGDTKEFGPVFATCERPNKKY